MIGYLIAGIVGYGIAKILEEDDKYEYKDGGKTDTKTSKKPLTEIVCQKCGWSWDVKKGGNDLYVCHKCFTDNSDYYLNKK